VRGNPKNKIRQMRNASDVPRATADNRPEERARPPGVPLTKWCTVEPAKRRSKLISRLRAIVRLPRTVARIECNRSTTARQMTSLSSERGGWAGTQPGGTRVIGAGTHWPWLARGCGDANCARAGCLERMASAVRSTGLLLFTYTYTCTSVCRIRSRTGCIRRFPPSDSWRGHPVPCQLPGGANPHFSRPPGSCSSGPRRDDDDAGRK